MKKQMKQVIEARKNAVLAFIKDGARTDLIERELALLAIDIVLALRTEKLAKAGCRCFKEIEFAMTGTMRKKLSEETRDLMNEMLLLDELGKKYGPVLTLAFDLAQKIIGGQGNRMLAGMKLPTVSLA